MNRAELPTARLLGSQGLALTGDSAAPKRLEDCTTAAPPTVPNLVSVPKRAKKPRTRSSANVVMGRIEILMAGLSSQEQRGVAAWFVASYGRREQME